MAQNSNPFENIEIRFNQLESILLDIKHRPKDPQPTDKPDRYIDTEEVAKLYNVSKVTINDWDNKGYIIGYRIGNTKRYKLSEILTAPKLIIRKKK
jgi:Helix-turn-helix domain